MKELDQYYTPHLEWEFSNFPITISQLNFERNNWGFNEFATISIWRDFDNELKGKISGVVSNYEASQEDNFVGKGNIIVGQTISGSDLEGNIIEIKGCLLTDFHTSSLNINFLEAILDFDKLKIKFIDESGQRNKIRLDWYFCNEVPAHFWGITLRNLKLENKKIRKGIDQYDDSLESYLGGSQSKDYTEVKIPGIRFIIAKVPSTLLPDGQKGLCLEFREALEKIDGDLLNGIEDFLSFLFGNELHHLGYSIISEQKLVEANLYSNTKFKKESVMPPIKFNLKYEWGDVSTLINQYLPQYLELRKNLPIESALSRYWIAKNTPLGANLPILSSAVEIIVGAYMKSKTDYKVEYLPQGVYLDLINDEIESLKIKLASIKGGDIIIKKILGDFRKGPNEKMNDFFSSIDIELSQTEKEAINLRNKMAHGTRNYSDRKNVHNDLILTRVYEVLFHRVLLKLLGYSGYYIDYSNVRCPLRPI